MLRDKWIYGTGEPDFPEEYGRSDLFEHEESAEGISTGTALTADDNAAEDILHHVIARGYELLLGEDL